MKNYLRRTLVCLTLLAVLAGIAAPAASAAGFQDVPSGHWTEESIRRSVELGFFRGTSATRFGMGEEITRSAFATVLCRFYGWDTKAKTSAFQDVPEDASYAGAVAALLEHGAITTQRPDFQPNEALTRADLAVMLVRSLGYSALAGLVQDLDIHFWDVHTNIGYIAMAYNLGLMNGTSADAFSPSRAVLREEVAVTLVRLYDKLHADAPEVTAVISAPEAGREIPDMAGLDVAAIDVGRLMGIGSKPAITPAMPAETAASLRDAAKKAGCKVLLHITGGPSTLDAPMAETAALLAKTVRDGSYDGLFLDMPEVKRERRKDLTQLVKNLRKALGDETTLYLAVEAPTWNGKEYGGYEYTTIAAAADRMILRVASYEASQAGGFPTAPVEPLEEVYYALTSMKGIAELNHLSLMVTTEPAVRGMDGRPVSLKAEELAAVLASGERRYSQRYSCAYMSAVNGDNPVALWYLDQEAIQARRKITQAFGVHHLCLSDWQDAPLGLLTEWN